MALNFSYFLIIVNFILNKLTRPCLTIKKCNKSIVVVVVVVVVLVVVAVYLNNIIIVLSCTTNTHTHTDIVYTYTSNTVLGRISINN